MDREVADRLDEFEALIADAETKLQPLLDAGIDTTFNHLPPVERAQASVSVAYILDSLYFRTTSLTPWSYSDWFIMM